MRTLCRLTLLPLFYAIAVPALTLRWIWLAWQFGWDEGWTFFSWIIGPDPPKRPHM